MDDDPRVIRSRRAILDATRALAAERGVADISVDAIAQRSGVARTTIYRHWATKAEVVIDALSTSLTTPSEPDTGSLEGDLTDLLTGLARALSHGPLASIMTTIMDAAERDPEFAALHRREVAARHGVIRDAIVRGIRRGELPEHTDPDEVLALTTGPILYRRLMTYEALDADFVTGVVARVLAAYRREPA